MPTCPTCNRAYPDAVKVCAEDGTLLPESPGFASPLDDCPPVGTILGSYKLLDIIGEGGMGRVYLGEHVRLGRKVAIKLLRTEYANNPAASQRFFSEARAVNKIRHDNIVEITDFFDAEGQFKYYVMEQLTGRTLTQVENEETLPLGRQLKIALQVADALIAVHAANIVHRDLKPDNIFLIKHAGQNDFVKLIDFGVAKLVESREGKPLTTTSVGAIIGTPEYMSPEQVSGREVDARSDIYSLGVILYEMATRRKPLEAKSFGEMVVKHLTVVPPKPSKLKDLAEPLPLALEDLILHCLEKEPARRPQTMQEVYTRLKAMAAGDEELLATFKSPSRTERRRAMLIGAGVAGFLAVAAGVTIAVVGGNGHADKTGRVAGDEASRPKVQVVRQVRLDLDSAPRGARVYAAGSSESLGVTPLSLLFEQSATPKVFELQLEGYEPVSQTVAVSQDARVLVTLAKKATEGVRTRKKTKEGSGGKRGTIDPFAE